MRMRWRHTSQSVKWNPGMFNQPLENKNPEIGRKRTDKTSAKQTKISYPNAPTASRKILSESKDARFSGLNVAVFRGCLSFCTASLFIPICKHFLSLKFKSILSLFIPICKHFFSLKFKSISLFYMAGKHTNYSGGKGARYSTFWVLHYYFLCQIFVIIAAQLVRFTLKNHQIAMEKSC